VDEASWAAAQRRRQERTLTTRNGSTAGKGGRPAKYLLSGLLTCSCGGRYEAIKYRSGVVYVCSTHRRKGSAVCSNATTIPVPEMDQAVILAVEQHSLTDAFVEQVLDTLEAPPDTARLQADIAKADQELRNVIELAKTAGQSIPQLASEVEKVNARRLELRGRLAAVPEMPDRDRLRLALRQRVADWRDVLLRHQEQSRLVVEQLTGGKLTMLKKGTRPFWLIELEAVALLAGLPHLCGSSPTGFEPVFQP
jgi:hypothetical protein